MSFRRRLLLSVVLILIVPVVLIVGLVIALTQESRGAKSDARISGALPAVLAEYRADVADAERLGGRIARDPGLLGVISAPPEARRSRLSNLSGVRQAESVSITRTQKPIVAIRGDRPVAVADTQVRAPDGTVYRLLVSTTPAAEFRSRAETLTGLSVSVGSGDRVLAANPTLDPDLLDIDGAPPQTIDGSGDDGDYRARILDLEEDAGPPVLLALAAPLGDSVLADRGPLFAAAGVAFLLLATLALVPLLRGLGREHDWVKAQALTDGLTGLVNHRHFRETISQEVERSQRFRHDLSVVLLDLDNFKHINDTYGHPQGDEVLRTVAKVIEKECRNIDSAARYGGEEFAVLLPETRISGAAEVAERIRASLESKPIPVDGRDEPLRVTGSFGVAGTPDHRLDASDLIEAADRALYEAKRAGKDRVVRDRPAPKEAVRT